MSTYFVDPENWIGQMYDSQFHGTWKASAWYQNAKVDELLRKARGITAQAERQPLYEEATRLIVADSPGHLGLQHGGNPWADRPGQGLPLLARGLRRRNALGAAGVA